MANPFLRSSEDSATLQVESGGNQFDSSGNTVTSPAGAQGVAQIMPTTAPEAAKLAGERFNPFRIAHDKDYNAKLGSAYLKAKIDEFGGDTDKGHAAYNAGAGRVRKAEEKARQQGGDWKDYLPDETKDYVKKINRAKESSPSRQINPFMRHTQPQQQPQPQGNPFLKGVKRGGSEVQALADVVLGTPAFIAEGIAAPFMAGANMLKGEVNPIQLAEKNMLGFQQSKLGKALSLSTADNIGNKEGVDRTTVNGLFSWLTGTINDTTEKLGKGSEQAAAGRMLITLGMSAVGAKGMAEGVRSLSKETIKNTAPSKVARPQFEAGKLTRVPTKNIVPKDPIAEFMQKSVDHEVEQHPVTEAAKEVFDPYAGKEHEDVMKEHLRNVLATQHEAETWGKSIEESVPDPAVRERIFKALGKEGKHDDLMPDSEKEVILNGTGEPDESGYINTGLKGSLAARYKLEADGRVSKSFWKAYVKSHPYSSSEDIRLWQAKTNQESKAAFAESNIRLEASIKALEARPSEDHAIPILKEIQRTFENTGKVAEKFGVVEGLLDNFAPHLLNWKESKLTKEQQQAFMDKLFGESKEAKLKYDPTKERFYKTVPELEKAIEGTGAKVEKDIAVLAPAYQEAMTKAILEKQMIDHFLNEKDTLHPHGLLTRDLQVGAMLGYVPFISRTSKVLQGILVHPDFADLMKHAFRAKDPNLLIRGAGNISMALKSLQTTMSLFHLKSLLEGRWVNSPELLLQDIMSGGKGIRDAKRAYDTGGMRVGDWERNGLVMSSEDSARGAIAKIGVGTDDILSKLGPEVKLVQRATEPFDKHIIQKFNEVTWDYAHTGGKLGIANHILSKIKARNPHIPDEQIMQEVAAHVNNILGGQDWLEIATSTNNHILKTLAMKAHNIEGRELAQILLFAPDWTVSTIRSMSEALPRELSKPQNWHLMEGVKGFFNPKTRHDLARRYVFNTAVTYFTVMNGLNYALSGHNLWDNKDPFRLDLGDGTTMQMAKHAMEVPEMIRAPDKAIGNKLGFIPKTISTLTMGRTNPFTATSTVKHDSALHRVGAVAESVLPFPLSGAWQAPKGEVLSRGLASAAGFPTYGQTDRAHTSPEVLKQRSLDKKKTQIENAKEKKKKLLERMKERQH